MTDIGPLNVKQPNVVNAATQHFLKWMYGMAVEVYVAFRGKPPAEWAEVSGVKAVSADSLASIEGKFVLVVGDRELAERLKVGYLTEEEAESS